MKFNHNKKRNTAFLYEMLIKELTKAAIKKDFEKRASVMKIIETFFSKDTILGKELKIYKSFFRIYKVDRASTVKVGDWKNGKSANKIVQAAHERWKTKQNS